MSKQKKVESKKKSTPLPKARVKAEVVPSSEEEGTEEGAWATATEVEPDAPFEIIQHSGEFDPTQVKIMIYGESGAGKTRFACSAPDVLVLDMDNGLSSVDWTVDSIRTSSLPLLRQAYEYLAGGDHEYGTVVLDTLNEMQTIILRDTIQTFPGVKRSYNSLPGQSDYGKMLFEWMELTRKFIALPMRVILVAQVGSRQFDTDVLQPSLIGKNSAREVARKMDVICYIHSSETSDDEGQFLPELVTSSPDFVTKDRSNRLPVSVAEPTWDALAAYWE